MNIQRKKLKLDTDMYQAFITGKKTQTRRPIRTVEYHEGWGTAFVLSKDEDDYICIERYPDLVASRCPYGVAGDVISVYLEGDTEEFRLAEITRVRMERVRSISIADCFYEGIFTVDGGFFHNYKYPTQPVGSIKRAFRELWSRYYSQAGRVKFSWHFNPYVWVIELEPHGWEIEA